MKKLFLLALMIIGLNCYAQPNTYVAQQAYINSNITTNGSRQITGAMLNTALNYLLINNNGVYYDVTRPYKTNQLVWYDGSIWISLSNQSAGTWDGSKWERAFPQDSLNLLALETRYENDSIKRDAEYTLLNGLITDDSIRLLNLEVRFENDTIRLNGIEVRFENDSIHLDNIETRFENDSTRLNGIETRFETDSIHLDNLEVRFENDSTRLNGIETRFENDTLRLDGVEVRMENDSIRLNGIEVRYENDSIRLNNVEVRFENDSIAVRGLVSAKQDTGTTWLKAGNWFSYADTTGTSFIGTKYKCPIFLKTNSTVGMKMLSNQYTCFGAQNPVERLHLAGTTDNTMIRFTNTSSGHTATDGFGVGLVSNGWGRLLHRENNSIIIGTNNLERMRVDSTGKVVIGHTTATNLLDVIGTGATVIHGLHTYSSTATEVPILEFQHSKSDTKGTLAQSTGCTLGEIDFYGVNNVSARSKACYIDNVVSTSIGTYIPTNIRIWMTGVGSSAASTCYYLFGTGSILMRGKGTSTMAASTSYSLGIWGTGASTIVQEIGIERNTTATNAGQAFYINRYAGATLASTNKDGGNVAIFSGTSTGSGTSKIDFLTSPGTAGATDTNTRISQMTINGNGIIRITKHIEQQDPDHFFLEYHVTGADTIQGASAGNPIPIATRWTWVHCRLATNTWADIESEGFTYDNDTIEYTGTNSCHIKLESSLTVTDGNGTDFELGWYNVTDMAFVPAKTGFSTDATANISGIFVSGYDVNANTGDRYILMIRNLTNADDLTLFYGTLFGYVVHY